jgi:hypothetical protein
MKEASFAAAAAIEGSAREGQPKIEEKKEEQQVKSEQLPEAS